VNIKEEKKGEDKKREMTKEMVRVIDGRTMLWYCQWDQNKQQNVTFYHEDN